MRTDELMPVAAGLFEGTGNSARLIGTRCTSCGTHYFPKTLSCRNPQCLEKATQDVLLSREGTLYSYTVQHYQPPAFGLGKGATPSGDHQNKELHGLQASMVLPL